MVKSMASAPFWTAPPELRDLRDQFPSMPIFLRNARNRWSRWRKSNTG
jgi:hypothetical protein